MSKVKEKLDIPKEWRQAQISDVCDVVNGSTPKSTVSEYWNGDVVWATPNDLRDSNGLISDSERKITTKGLESIGNRFVPSNSVILSTRAPIGYVGVTKQKTAFNQGCKGMVCKDLFPTFLYYVLLKNGPGLKKFGAGSTFPELSTSALKKYVVSVPPLPEQKKIAEILGAVDEEIQKTDEIIAATEKLKRGLMQKLFTRGIGHTKFKKTKVGEVPEVWNVEKVGDALETSSGGTPLKSKREYYENGDIPWFTSGEVRQGRVNQAKQFITKLGLDNSSAKIFPKNTVLVAMYGATAGQVGFLGTEAATNQAVCGVLPNRNFDPEFVYYFLLGKTQELISQARGAAQPNISQTVIRDTFVPVPSINEQKQIADMLTSVDEKISVNQKLKAKLALLKKGLMQDLLSGNKRVKI